MDAHLTALKHVTIQCTKDIINAGGVAICERSRVRLPVWTSIYCVNQFVFLFVYINYHHRYCETTPWDVDMYTYTSTIDML
jgi:hypothetical protein